MAPKAVNTPHSKQQPTKSHGSFGGAANPTGARVPAAHKRTSGSPKPIQKGGKI